MLLLAILSGLLAATPPRWAGEEGPLTDELELVLTTDRSHVVAYEPVRARVSLRNKTGVPLMAQYDVAVGSGNLVFQYRDEGGSFVSFPLPQDRLDRRGYAIPRFLEPDGQETGEAVLLFDTERQRYLFESEGVTELRALLTVRKDKPVLESNVVAVDCSGVDPRETAAVREFLDPGIAEVVQYYLCWGGKMVSASSVDASAAFLEKHPTSVYAPAVHQGLISVLRDYAREPYAKQPYRQLWLDLTRDSDQAPPSLYVDATPRLIPVANGELIAVNVVASSGDNVDPSPTIRLVSITCGAQCNAAEDIVDAEIGSDDRELKLRAARGAEGEARVYMITYQASDYAGNTTTRTTAVLVPRAARKEE
jgi:hypothetical protein